MVTITATIYFNIFITVECVIGGYKDCEEWLDHGYTTSGVYPITLLDGGEMFLASNL